MSRVEVTKLAEGTRPVLFAVHASGGILSFVRLARRLGPGQPCYLLKGRGIDSARHSFKDCYDLAQSYVEEILRIQPDGPYMILGRQSETVIEVGQQLLQRGKTVSLTIVLNTGPPKHKLGGRIPSRLRRFLYRRRRNFVLTGSLFLDWVRVTSKRIWTRSPSADDPYLEGGARLRRFARKRSTETPKYINQDLISGYVAKPYHARVVYIQSVEQKRKEPDYADRWRAATDEVVYYTTPGGVATMYDEPHVYILAGLVQQECDSAAGNSGAAARTAAQVMRGSS